MKPFLSITLVTWMCIFAGAGGAYARTGLKKSALIAREKLTWLTDMEAAKKKASSQEKKIFVLFTGSDWCPPCKMFKKNVLDKLAFKKAAGEDYVFVVCDFPSGQTLSKRQQKHNDDLAKKFSIASFPSVVIADEKGGFEKQITGYQQEGVAGFLKKL